MNRESHTRDSQPATLRGRRFCLDVAPNCSYGQENGGSDAEARSRNRKRTGARQRKACEDRRGAHGELRAA
jgi:hypothetical protein